MTAYLSKIAARFDGSGVNTTTENQNGSPALMPSRNTFGSESATDIDFTPAPIANEFSFLESNYDQSSSDNEKILKPTPNYIGSSPVESIRSFFYLENNIEHIDQESLEPTNVIAPQKSVIEKSIPEQQPFEEKEKFIPNHVGSSQKNVKQNSQEIDSYDLQLGPIAKDSFSSTTFRKQQQLKDKKKIPAIFPNSKKQKEQLSLAVKTASKGKALNESPTNFSSETIGQKEMLKSQPYAKQLRPAKKKQRLPDSTTQKKHHENKIRIGSIKVEIIPAKSKKVKTQAQRLPQQKVALPSKASVNPARFPLRFGLKQM